MEAFQRVNLGVGRKLPMTFQTEAAECGLACMAMIIGYHGGGADLPDLRRRFAVSLKGARLADLVRVADRVGFASRPLRVELDELRELQTPCILHWDLNHFVVLRAVRRRHIVVHDPSLGIRRVPIRQASEHFSGVALEMTPAGGFNPQRSAPRLRLTDVLGRMVGLKRSLAQVFMLALTIEAFAVVQPFFLQWVVDHALVSADRDLLATLALGFGLLMLLQVTVTALRGWILMVMSTSLKLQGRANLFSHLQRLPTAFFETRHLSDILSRFGSMEAIQNGLTGDLIEALLDGLLAIVTLAIMYLFSPLLASLVLASALLYGALRWALYTPLREASMGKIVWTARRDNHFLETLRAIKTIKLLGGQDERRAHWLNLLVETVNRDLVGQKLRLLFRVANGVLQGTVTIAVVWVGARLVLDNAFSVGMLLAFIAYKSQFSGRVSGLIDKAVDLRMLRLHGERLSDIVLTEPEAIDPGIGRAQVEPSVEVRDLRFRYSAQDPWVLDGITFRIEAGESVAIVGPSGCGKTTLLKVLSSLLQPTSGQLLIGGEPVAHLGLEGYRRMLGVVMQDDQLLAGSIADNICFFDPQPSREEIERCAALAAIHDDIVAMPMGYDSLIGDMGAALSGGQKQRVLLARALYRKPRILLLDEATSHLDVALESSVNAAIRQSSMTRIIVAHRPETIRSADRTIALLDGRIEPSPEVGRLGAAVSIRTVAARDREAE